MIIKIIILLYIYLCNCYMKKIPKCNNLYKLNYHFNDIKPILNNNIIFIYENKYIHYYIKNKIILLKLKK